MNPYLTSKATKSLAWRFPVALFCCVMSVATVLTTLERQTTMNGYDVTAFLLLLALFLWPAIRIGRHLLLRYDALRIARILTYTTEESVSMENLHRDLPMRHLTKRLATLIQRDYLQNVHIDSAKNAVVLTAPNQQVIHNDIIEMECPNCGAKNQVIKGRVGRCIYCEQPITLHNKRKKGIVQ